MPLNSSTLSIGTYSGLLRAGQYLFNKLSQRLSSADYPEEIKNSMSLGTVEQADSFMYVDIIFDLNVAPMGLAFEFGSGEHATRGTAQRYKIEPKEKDVLAFPEEKWPDFVPPIIPGKKMIGMRGGKFLLRFVEHPGIEPRPYIRPTLDAERANLRAIIGKTLIEQIRKGGEVIEEIR